jgi:hypothetical protein
MTTPGDVFRAFFDAFESLFWWVVAGVVVVVLALLGLGYWVAHC